jgi:tripeptide aminopeptidase
MRFPQWLMMAGLLPVTLGWMQDRSADVASRLMADPSVQAALEAARQLEPQTLEDQIRICEVPAPPFGEARRAEAYRGMLAAAGLQHARIDAAGNVLAERPGFAGRPTVVLAAHLDTVFPEGTDVKVTRQGDVLRGPGISDNCRGLAVLVAVARALERAGIRTRGTVTFAGTVGEEGLGDLRGVRHLVDVALKGRIDQFISIDGAGSGITNVAVGSRRYRVTVTGPGGHSFGSFGNPNPIHALGRALAGIAEFQVPAAPRTTFSVGRIGGGTSVNALPADAWMEIDMRSVDPAALRALDARFHDVVDRAMVTEIARWGGGRIEASKEIVSDRPAGRTPPDSLIVRTAVSVTQALGLPGPLGEGSTDANYPISVGIPAINIDGGGRSSGTHSLDEVFFAADAWKGTQRATLLTIALAQAD